MSEPESEHFFKLHMLVHAKFREAFGDPIASLGGGEQWSIETFSTGSPIHILVNGCRNGPSVWVFDPTNPREEKAASHVMIAREAELTEIIENIRSRVAWSREQNANSKLPVSEQKSFDSPAPPDERRPRSYNQDNPRLP